MRNVSEIKEISQSNSVLWELAKEGARTMIQGALIQEQEEFISNHSHLLDKDGKRLIVKNGYLPERNIKTSAGEIPVKAPRVRTREGGESVPIFSSSILPKYLRNTKEIDELIPFLYLKGVSTNDFPAEHWQHIRSTNPIESTFATVKLRTYKTKGSGTSKETLTMVFKMIQSAQKNWRRLRGFSKLILVLNGVKFKDGVLDKAA